MTSKKICSIPGCENPVNSRYGWCGGHYLRWRKTGDVQAHIPLRKQGLSLDERLDAALAEAAREGDCLISPRGTCSGGYAELNVNGRPQRIPRLMLERKLGRKLKSDEHTRHSCHRRRCINPDHLSPGSAWDNTQDKVKAGRAKGPTGERHASAKLTEDDVREIRRRYAAGGITQTALGDEFGVLNSTISRIINRQKWAHI